MGQKVNPYGIRLGINKTWSSRWFSKNEYTKLLELRAERDNLHKEDDNLVKSYNMYTNQEHNLQCFIIQLCGVI